MSDEDVEIRIKGILCEAALLNKQEDVEQCFNLLDKLFTNLINKPDEAKYRLFNKNNEHLKNKVLGIPQSLILLEILGYKIKEGDILELSKQNVNNIQICKKELENYIKKKDSNDNFSNSNQKSIFEQRQIEIKKQEEIEQSEGKFKVTMLQYDLTQGMAKQFGPMLIGKAVEGVWHTAILVHNLEFFYGGGICTSKPRQTQFGKPYKEVHLGYTEIPLDLLKVFLNELKNDFKMENYNLINHNCNHFSNTLAEFLTGKGIPNDILKQHEILLGTPMGNYLMPMLEKMNTSPDMMR